MRVVISDYFGHAFPAQLARALAGRGHEVLHLHCRSFVTGKGRLERTDADPPGVQFAAVDLGRPFAKYDVLRRVGHEWKTARALSQLLRGFRPEAVLSIAPLVVQLELLRVSRALGAGFVFWQQDVMSVAARRVLGRRSPFVGVAVERTVAELECRLLRRSDVVVAISEDFLPQLRRCGLDESRAVVIENWAPLEELPALPRDNAWAREHGLEGSFVFLYSGTLGFKHDPSLLLELARWARRRDALVVVVSEGPGADWLAEHGGDEPGLRVLPYQPHDRLPEVLASADVLVAVLEPEAGAFSVPSKILTYLCAARPLLASLPDDNLAARVVEHSGGGVVVPPGNLAALLGAAEALLGDAGRRAELARRARDHAERSFDIDAIAARFEATLGRATMPKG
ncbi:MAG TPA: glycosyltransferase family 4 protein [Gaiellaceae bacterium]|nr:glycosyltransferase family 4 protein [Gaiellaceae bacterium]